MPAKREWEEACKKGVGRRGLPKGSGEERPAKKKCGKRPAKREWEEACQKGVRRRGLPKGSGEERPAKREWEEAC